MEENFVENTFENMPPVQENPPKKRLWQKLNEQQYYSKSYEDFDKQFSSPDKIQKLYDALNKKRYYTRSLNDFNRDYFDPPAPNVSQSSSTDPVKISENNFAEEKSTTQQSLPIGTGNTSLSSQNRTAVPNAINEKKVDNSELVKSLIKDNLVDFSKYAAYSKSPGTKSDDARPSHDIQFSKFESEATKLLQQKYPNASVRVDFKKGNNLYNEQGGRSIKSQAAIMANGNSQTPVSLHNFNSARDYDLYVDGKIVDPDKNKQLYKDVLWSASKATGLHHLEDWDVAHISLVEEGKGTAIQQIKEKYRDLLDTPEAQDTIKYLTENADKNPKYREILDSLNGIIHEAEVSDPMMSSSSDGGLRAPEDYKSEWGIGDLGVKYYKPTTDQIAEFGGIDRLKSNFAVNYPDARLLGEDGKVLVDASEVNPLNTEPSFAERMGNAVLSILPSMQNTIASIPEFIYNFPATFGNLLASAVENNAGQNEYSDLLKTTGNPYQEMISLTTSDQDTDWNYVNPFYALDQFAKQGKNAAEYYNSKNQFKHEGIYDAMKSGDYSEAGEQLAVGIVHAVPFVLQMMATEGVSAAGNLGIASKAALSSVPFMNMHYQELKDREDLSYNQKMGMSAIAGFTDYTLGSALGTQKLVRETLFKSMSQEEIAKMSSGFVNKLLYSNGIIPATMRGGLTLATNTMANNITKGNDPMQGVVDSFILGSTMDFGIAAAPKIGSYFKDKGAVKKMEILDAEVKNLQRDLQQPDILPEISDIIQQKLEEKTKEMSDIIDANITDAATLTTEQRQRIDAIDKRTEGITALLESPNAEKLYSETAINAYKDELVNLQKQRDQVLNEKINEGGKVSDSEPRRKKSIEVDENIEADEWDALMAGGAEKFRTDGKKTVNGVEYVRQEPIADVRVGKSDQVKFADGVDVPFDYVLVDASKLQPAHSNGVRNNNHFIPEAQPKNRKDAASLKSSDEIAAKINVRELGENTNAYSGAPIINDRGEVIQGNNRSDAIRKHYESGRDKYKNALANAAEQFGLTKEQVEWMDRPVLARRVKASDADAITLGNYEFKDIESGGSARINPVNVSRRMPRADKARLVDAVFGGNTEMTINEAMRVNGKKVVEVLKPYLSDTQKASLFKQNGEFRPEAIKDMEGLVTNFLFEGADVSISDAYDALPSRTQQGINRSLPKLLSLPAAKTIIPELQRAIGIVAQYKKSGVESFESWANQADMFAGGKSPKTQFGEVEMVLAKLLSEAKTPKNIYNALGKYANKVSPNEGDMFTPKTDGESKDSGLKDLKENINEETRKPIEQASTAPGSDSGSRGGRNGRKEEGGADLFTDGSGDSGRVEPSGIYEQQNSASKSQKESNVRDIETLKGVSEQLKKTGLVDRVEFVSNDHIGEFADTKEAKYQLGFGLFNKSDFKKSLTGKITGLNESVVREIQMERQDIISRAKRDGSYMRAPNGRPSNLSPSDWTTVRTNRFKEWFGDWEKNPRSASKIVDQNGEPTLYYNGSKIDFTEYDKKFFYTGEGAMYYGAGFYFTPNLETAESYGRQSVVGEYRSRAQSLSSSISTQKLENALFSIPILSKSNLSEVNLKIEGLLKELDKVILEANEKSKKAKNPTDKIVLEDMAIIMDEARKKVVKEANALKSNGLRDPEPISIKLQKVITDAFDSSNSTINNFEELGAGSGKVKSLFLNVRNPLDWEAKATPGLVNKINEALKKQGKPYIKSPFTNNGSVYRAVADALNEPMAPTGDVRQYTKTSEFFESIGIDGVIHTTSTEWSRGQYFKQSANEKQVITFEANQIKDAGSNVGSFSSKVNDMWFQVDSEIKGLWDPSTKTVIINKDKATLDTPIHEFSHAWEAATEQLNPKLHKLGMDLVDTDEAKPYRDFVSKKQPDLIGDDFKKEVLAQAIGDNGAKLINSQRPGAFKQWLERAWSFIGKMVGLSEMSTTDLMNISFNEYSKAAAVDLLKGKPFSIEEQFTIQDRKNSLTNERIKPEVMATTEKPRKLNEISGDLVEGLNATVLHAKGERRGVLGSYRSSDTLVKISKAGDVDTMAHEVGHLLDDRYNVFGKIPASDRSKIYNELQWFADRGGSNPSGRMSDAQKIEYLKREGIAEYFRAKIANPKEANRLAPIFDQHFEKLVYVDPAVKEVLDKFSKEYINLANSSNGELMSANYENSALPDKKGFKEWLEKSFPTKKEGLFQINAFDRLKVNFTNSMAIANKAFRFAVNQLDNGKALPIHKQFDIVARNFAGEGGKINWLMERGLHDAENKLIKGSDGKPMNVEWLIKDLDSSSPEALHGEMDEVIRLLIAERTVEYSNKFKRDSNLSGIGAGLKTDLDVASGHLMDFEKLKSSDHAKYDRIRKAADKYREYADATLRYAVDKGRISEADYQAISDNNQFYVSMKRIKESSPLEEQLGYISKSGGSLGSVREVLHTAKGGSDMISNPYQSLLMNMANIVREADRNEVVSTFMEPLTKKRSMGDGDAVNYAQIAHEVNSQSGLDRIIEYYDKGEKKRWRIADKDVFSALKNLEGISDGPIWKALAFPAKVIRSTVTNFPVFAARNATRDTIARLIHSRTNSGIKDFLGTKPYEDAFHLYGGSQAGFHLIDKLDYSRKLSDTVKEITKKGGIVLDPRKIWSGYKAFLEKSENVNRMAEFKSAYEKAIKEGMSERDAGLYAAYQARDLMDFAVAGDFIRKVNQIIPFTNAAVQGLVRTAKIAKEQPGGFALRMALYTIVPTLITRSLVIMMGDDKEYKQLPDYQRDLFWNFKVPGIDSWFSIPKPFELGLASSFVDRSMDMTTGSEAKDAYSGLGHAGFDAMIPFDRNSLMGSARPLIEAMTNKDTFRDTYIVPQYEEGKDMELRKGANKASRLGKALSSAFSLVDDVDPRKVDHVIKGYTTYVGDWAMTLSDIGRDDSRNKFGVSKTGFMKEAPISSSKSVSEFFNVAKRKGKERSREVKYIHSLIQDYYAAESEVKRKQIAETIWREAEKYKKVFESMESEE
ncbi:LPD38 domain-containing protein [Sphingobacterium detergens]|uniref:LPD38 domain-containing protein n=1 Tax=Sphingobacterium detergens TaxID=1145106 RepID=UPI003AACADD6